MSTCIKAAPCQYLEFAVWFVVIMCLLCHTISHKKASLCTCLRRHTRQHDCLSREMASFGDCTCRGCAIVDAIREHDAFSALRHCVNPSHEEKKFPKSCFSICRVSWRSPQLVDKCTIRSSYISQQSNDDH